MNRIKDNWNKFKKVKRPTKNESHNEDVTSGTQDVPEEMSPRRKMKVEEYGYVRRDLHFNATITRVKRKKTNINFSEVLKNREI